MSKHDNYPSIARSEKEIKAEVFNFYLSDLGIEEQDVVGADILDIGSANCYFADTAIEKGAKSVLSVEAVKPKKREEILTGNNVKLYGYTLDDDSLEEKISQSSQGGNKFDLIVSHSAILYWDVASSTGELDYLAIQEKTRKELDFIGTKLKKGEDAKAIIYPYFMSQSHVKVGDHVKDFSMYNQAIERELASFQERQPGCKIWVEKVKELNGSTYFRIMINIES